MLLSYLSNFQSWMPLELRTSGFNSANSYLVHDRYSRNKTHTNIAKVKLSLKILLRGKRILMHVKSHHQIFLM